MPRPRSLSATAVAAAALAVIDRDGLQALSMRTVATELGLTTMALYRYVGDREELERLVVDLVLADVDLVAPPRAQWRKQITALYTRAWEAMRAHPAVTPLTLTHRGTSRQVQSLGEAVLGVLTSAGFAGPQRVIAFRTLLAYVIGSLLTQQLGALDGQATAELQMQHHHPLLAATATTARAITPEREFQSGLAVVLAGLDPR